MSAMNVNVRLAASKADLDEARAICETVGLSLSKAVRDGAAKVAADPRTLGEIVVALSGAPSRVDWSADKQITTILMPPEIAKTLSEFSRQMTTSLDWVLRMVVDGIRLGVIVPAQENPN